MTSLESRSGGRHCADVAGAFSPGWFDEYWPPRGVFDGPLWECAHMSESTRNWLIRRLLGSSMEAAA